MEYKKVQDLSPAQAAYLAGLIDGEGTITLSRRNRYKHRGLVVTISNTEMILLKHVQTVTGVGKITNKRIAQPSHTPSYTYQVTNRQALGLLEQITRYMKSHKAARARLALKKYLRLTPRNGRYTKNQLTERETFINEFFSIGPSIPIAAKSLQGSVISNKGIVNLTQIRSRVGNSPEHNLLDCKGSEWRLDAATKVNFG